MEVLPLVTSRFSHLADLDHTEHNLAEIARGVHAPGTQHRGGHEAILLERILPCRIAEFLATDMPLHLTPPRSALAPTRGPRAGVRRLPGRRFEVLGRRFGSHTEIFLTEGQRLEHKQVGVEFIAMVPLEQLGQRVGGIDVRHHILETTRLTGRGSIIAVAVQSRRPAPFQPPGRACGAIPPAPRGWACGPADTSSRMNL